MRRGFRRFFVGNEDRDGGENSGAGRVETTDPGILKAATKAAAMADALGKRAIGSFARLRRITSESAGGICRLSTSGGVGAAFTCCIIMSAGFSPWKDRKSTRLNSSHLVISYAVFCLKKKKKKNKVIFEYVVHIETSEYAALSD